METENRLNALLLKKEWFVESKKNPIKEEYDFKQELGSGAFGKVMLAQHKVTQEYRAVKIVHKLRVKDIEQFQNEVRILATLDHPNVIKILEYYESDRIFFLVAEYCEGGELFHHIAKQKRLTEKDAANCMRQMIAAVRYCHDKGISHRDIKPENFLLKFEDDDNSLKLIDFGLAKVIDLNTIMTSINGTPFYVAPEVLDGHYGKACDLWSLGIVLYIMLCGCPPFQGKDNEEILLNVRNGILSFQLPIFKKVSPEAMDLIKKLLDRNPVTRITADEAYKHSWIQRQVEEKMNEIEIPMDAIENLGNFLEARKLKRATLTYIASKIPEEEIEPLRDAFLKLDQNGDGYINKEELESGLSTIGNFVDPQAISNLVQILDSNQNGSLDYTEFIAACMNSQNYLDELRIRACFIAMDRDKDGQISLEELREFLKADLVGIDEATIEKIMNEVDIDNDGQLSYEEFLQMLKNN